MTKAYLMIRPYTKLPILFTDETIVDAHERMELVDTMDMYEDDIIKVNNFFIALDQLCLADYHLSPINRKRFAKVVGDAVKNNFSISNLLRAGLLYNLKGENEV